MPYARAQVTLHEEIRVPKPMFKFILKDYMAPVVQANSGQAQEGLSLPQQLLSAAYLSAEVIGHGLLGNFKTLNFV